MNGSPNGLTLKIPPEVAARLRQQEAKNVGDTSEVTNNADANQKEKGVTNSKKGEEEMLPIISIDLERLIGYRPESTDELDSIRSQLLAAMWTRCKETTPIPIEQTDQTQPPPDFDVQVCELFETGAAHFSRKNAESVNDSSTGTAFLPIKYPPKLILPPPRMYSDGPFVETANVWKQIIRKPAMKNTLPLVEKLWRYLEGCSRNLLWKSDMSKELKKLIQEELARLEYDEWTESKRQSKLDNLYSIRETIVHQVELAKVKLDDLEEKRETQVQEEMQQCLRKRNGGGLESFGTTELSFPEEFQLLGLRDEVYEEEDDWGVDDDQSSYSSRSGESDVSGDGYSSEKSSVAGEDGEDEEYDCDNEIIKGNNSEHIPLTDASVDNSAGEQQPLSIPSNEVLGEEKNQSTNNPQLPTSANDSTEIDESSEQPLSTPFLRRKERREKAKRKKRQERKDSERKTKLEQLKKLEEEIRARHTTRDLIMAQTLWDALDKKSKNVEELLESLQDEVWQAEEEVEDDSQEKQTKMVEPSFSLLDQILAMILGSTPVQHGMTPQEHYKFVQNEHTSIVDDWKAYFGRLPPPAGENQPREVGDGMLREAAPPSDQNMKTALEKRLALGITDNADDDWDAIDNWDDCVELKKNNTPPAVVANKREPIVATSSQSKSAKSTPAEKKVMTVGLRPGGNVNR